MFFFFHFQTCSLQTQTTRGVGRRGQRVLIYRVQRCGGAPWNMLVIKKIKIMGGPQKLPMYWTQNSLLRPCKHCQFIRLRAAPSGATKVFIQLLVVNLVTSHVVPNLRFTTTDWVAWWPSHNISFHLSTKTLQTPTSSVLFAVWHLDVLRVYFPLTQSDGHKGWWSVGLVSSVQAASLTFESHCVISTTAQHAGLMLSSGHPQSWCG